MELAEFTNQISEILCGHCEAHEDVILDRARYLVQVERTANLRDPALRFVEVLDELQKLIEDIGSGG